MRSRRDRAWLILFGLVVIPAVHAGPMSVGAGVQVGYTDNVNLSKTKQADAPMEVYAELHYRDESARVSGALDARLAHRRYLQGHAADEIVPRAHGNLSFGLQPNRFAWVLDTDWTQTRIDRLGPDSPSNLENQFAVWTGPDLQVPLSSAVDMTVKGRAGYSQSSEDSEGASEESYRFGTALDFRLKKGAHESARIGVAARSVRYLDDTEQGFASDDFDIFDAFVGYDWTVRGGELSLDLGSSMASSTESDRQTGLLLRVDANGPAGRRGRAGLRLRVGFQDQANSALATPVEAGLPAAIGDQSSGYYQEQRLEGYYRRESRRASLLASLFLEKRDFTRRIDDESNLGANLSWNARLSRSSNASLYGLAKWTDFEGIATQTVVYAVGAKLSRRLSRAFAVSGEVRYQTRVSNDVDLEYDETAVMVSFSYAVDL